MSRLAERFRKGRRYLQRWMSPRRLGPVLLLKIFGANVSISISEVHISYLHILLYGNVLDHLIFKTVSVHRLVNLHHFHITTQSVIEGANLLILSPQYYWTVLSCISDSQRVICTLTASPVHPSCSFIWRGLRTAADLYVHLLAWIKTLSDCSQSFDLKLLSTPTDTSPNCAFRKPISLCSTVDIFTMFEGQLWEKFTKRFGARKHSGTALGYSDTMKSRLEFPDIILAPLLLTLRGWWIISTCISLPSGLSRYNMIATHLRAVLW